MTLLNARRGSRRRPHRMGEQRPLGAARIRPGGATGAAAAHDGGGLLSHGPVQVSNQMIATDLFPRESASWCIHLQQLSRGRRDK